MPIAVSISASELIVAVGCGLALGTIVMLAQLASEVKKGMQWASKATQRYQQLAVRSLLVQGLLPTLVYIVPGFLLACLQFAPRFFVIPADFDRIGSIILSIIRVNNHASPMIFLTVTKHTFINSLAILYCSPSYRKKAIAVLTTYSFAPTRVTHRRKE
ncbi:hypothetical protein PRIPAC_78167, partial [Pristionchus pacificus]|uniref:G protein-coupled receptor n=1 Tax=Pristionchus pacificus TaxID=54126 RepID=A0A2A6CKN3_PRIPA